MRYDGLIRTYSFLEILKLILYYIRSKLLCRQIRLVRFPIILRGKKFIDFGKNLTTGYWCRIEVFPTDNINRKRIIFGNDVQINDFVHISALDRVEIGDSCLFASHIYISDNSHGDYQTGIDSGPNVPPRERPYISKPVIIGKNVWLGEGVIVMPGVQIGDGCIIGAHSVVNHSIPDNCIAVGSPAKVIKQYSFITKTWEKV